MAHESVVYLSKFCDLSDPQDELQVAWSDFHSATLENARTLIPLHIHLFLKHEKGDEILTMLTDAVQSAWKRVSWQLAWSMQDLFRNLLSNLLLTLGA